MELKFAVEALLFLSGLWMFIICALVLVFIILLIGYVRSVISCFTERIFHG